MTISAISPSGASPLSSFQSDRQAFGQLVNALQSGNLTAAQSAYNTLSSSPLAQGNGPFAQALQQIGQDLQSTDPSALADAQKVLASLQQQMQAHGHHHHHHGGGGEVYGPPNPQAASSSNGTNGSDGDDTSTTIQIQITVTSDSVNKVNITA
jgi:hypothetical protein